MKTIPVVRFLAPLVAALVCAAPGAWAIDPAAGTSGAAFMKIGMGSSRAMALGKAYVALAEGSEALTWNPAGLGTTQQREVSYSYLSYVQGISSPFFMSYAQPLGRTVIGANAAYLSVDGFEARNANGVPLDNTNVRVQNGFTTLGLARSFWYEKFFLGASLKGVHEDNAGTVHNVIAGDIGALFKPNSYLTFGFASQNMGASSRNIAQVTRGGVAVRMFDMLNTSFELNKPSDNSMRMGIGAEFILPEDLLQVGQISLRVGYYSADDLGYVLQQDRSFLYPLVSSPRISYGIGLYTAQAFGYGIGFDYALLPMGALGTVDQLSFKIKF